MAVAAASVYPSCPQGTSIVSAVCSQVRKAGQVWSGPGAWIRWSVVQGARGGARSPLLPKDCLLLKTLTILSSPCHRDADKLECTASVAFVTLVLEARGRKGTRKVVPADHRQRETQTCRRGGREKTSWSFTAPGALCVAGIVDSVGALPFGVMLWFAAGVPKPRAMDQYRFRGQLGAQPHSWVSCR